MTKLVDTLQACKILLPEDFFRVYAKLFEPEHVERLASRLLNFWEHGVPASFPEPHFSVECTPPLSEVFAPFETSLIAWERASDKLASQLLQQFAASIVAAGCKNILILLGQRLTPASLTDVQGIPPTRAQLIAAVQQPYNKEMTVAGRAWSKHAHRSPDKFWGEVRGSSADKNQAAFKLIVSIMDNTTWWNIFGHFQHETVYEARVPTGHGVRWGKGGNELIGFLEPFDEPKENENAQPGAGSSACPAAE